MTAIRRYLDDGFSAVRVSSGFWGRLIERNRSATLPHVLRKCEEEGHIRNLDIAAGRADGTYAGGPDRDSNLFKVIEAAAYSLALAPDNALDAYLDQVIEKIAAVQEPDGYLQSYFSTQKSYQRYSDLHRSHELYCVGHLIEAAVAHFEATGKKTLLQVAIRSADHVDAIFGLGKFETAPGHQEIELALVRLFKTTGERRYLDLARYFVDIRGNKERVQREYSGKPVIESERHPGRNRPPAYRQDHLPMLEQREATGHAVRAGYLYAALTDVAMEYDSPAHAVAAKAIWDNIVGKKLYLTGGVGTHQYRDEGFGDDYLLPNDSAYCETCGGIALLLFSHRLNLLTGHARYADLIETILYNHLLSSIDQSGCNFNYRNPLESQGDRQRHPWANPACCATNIVRIIPQIGRLIYAVRGHDLYVNQFINSTADLTLAAGAARVTQETDYPWAGASAITLRPDQPRELALHIRIPGWAEGRPVPSDLYRVADVRDAAVRIAVNGVPVDAASRTDGYCVIRRTWQPGDRITLDLGMPVQRIHAHAKVEACRDRVALMRGPLLYCLEEIDVPTDPHSIELGDDVTLRVESVPDLLGGVNVLKDAAGLLTAVPYYTWNNRKQCKMLVWIRERRATGN